MEIVSFAPWVNAGARVADRCALRAAEAGRTVVTFELGADRDAVGVRIELREREKAAEHRPCTLIMATSPKASVTARARGRRSQNQQKKKKS